MLQPAHRRAVSGGGQTGSFPFMSSALRHDQGCRRRSRHAPSVALLIANAALALLSGCASHVHVPHAPGRVPAMFHPIAVESTEFDYLSHGYPLGTLDVLEGESGDYWVRTLQMPSSGAVRHGRPPLTARYDQGKAAGAKPLVIVLPVWGVSAYPSSTIAASLRGEGEGAINVLQVDGPEMLFDWAALADAASEAEFHRLLAQMVERFIDTVTDVRRLVDWAQTRPEIDAERIALVGFSMSAIVASIVLANEPRIAAGVLMVGGADLHEILAACNGRIRRTRQRLLERFDWSIEDFKEELRAPLAPVNPVRFAGRVAPERLLVIEAAADSCIPKSSRERFWQALGRPERISYQYDHRTTFLAMTFLGGYHLQRQIHGFLDRAIAPRLVRYEAAQVDSNGR
jgi:dienelactone hydrolase